MRDNAEIFRDSDCSEVVERIRVSGNNYENMEKYLVDILKVIDPNNKGYVSGEEIREGFKKFNLYLTTQELITLLDYLKRNKDGLYSMEDLYYLIVCYK
jgi:Ca2+-binding EF-hand superfamily protein